MCGRWYVDGGLDYGTKTTSPAWLYPLDGNRFVTGTDPAREGGDVWSTDAALKVMQDDFTDADTDDWRGLFVGLAGPDKMAHMWGPDDDVTGSDATEAIDPTSPVRSPRSTSRSGGSSTSSKPRESSTRRWSS